MNEYKKSNAAELLQNVIVMGNEALEVRRIKTKEALQALKLTHTELIELKEECRIHGVLSLKTIEFIFSL